uniref:Uncharacterized protein n=1 Tax=Sphaerodactylus townsendi TaxID=933632 RepID=A0ACB8G293_9SAUR
MRWQHGAQLLYDLREALHLEQSAEVHGAMGRKRLITDSFQVVRKKKRDSKEVKAQSPPCDRDLERRLAVVEKWMKKRKAVARRVLVKKRAAAETAQQKRET